MKYIFTVDKAVDSNGDIIYSLDCCEGFRPDGTRKLLHNEISAEFKLNGNELYVISGWHIGTSDYTLDEGDNFTIEYYHPGLTEQVLEYLKGNGMIE